MDERLRIAAKIRHQLRDRVHSDSIELLFEEVLSAALALPEKQRAMLIRRIRKERKSETQNEPFRLSRLNIFLGDFREARDFAEYILERNLHAFKNPQSRSRLIHLAFNTSLIVSYCRPFHKSNDQEGEPKVSITETEVNTLLDPDERILHKRIFAERDQAFAHSDSIVHELEGWDYSGQLQMFYKIAREPLSPEETKTLSLIIKKWIKHFEKLKETARNNLYHK